MAGTSGRAVDERDAAGAPRGASASGRARWRWVLAFAAAAFGLATIVSGGRVLFGGAATRAAAGAYVGFVVAFNFAAGFAYVAAATGLALARRWSVAAGAAIAAATALVFALFGAHVATGGAFEWRTVVAMAFRTVFWLAFAVVAARLARPVGPAGRGGGPRAAPAATGSRSFRVLPVRSSIPRRP